MMTNQSFYLHYLEIVNFYTRGVFRGFGFPPLSEQAAAIETTKEIVFCFSFPKFRLTTIMSFLEACFDGYSRNTFHVSIYETPSLVVPLYSR